MPLLDAKWFRGDGSLNPVLANKLEIASLGAPVANTLSNLGWDGVNPVATIGLELSPDNRHVQRAQLVIRGQLAADPIVRSAATIWPKVGKDVTLRIDVPDASRFQFASGGTASNYLACEEAKFRFLKGDQPVLPADWADIGVTEFAIRCITHLDRNSNKPDGPLLKYVVLLVPLDVNELRRLEPASASSAWPGFKLTEGTCRFFPGSDQTGWGDPVCPLLCRGSHQSEAPNLPPGDEIRFHIAAVMRAAKLAVHCKTANGWRKQRDQAEADIRALERDPTITWPTAPRHAAPQGQFQKLHLFFQTASVSTLSYPPPRTAPVF
jgi:hypothetical protein